LTDEQFLVVLNMSC